MAYHDENGMITIDEVAAQNDIRRIAEAQKILESVNTQLGQLIDEAYSFKGETSQALTEKAMELSTETQRLISNLEETQTYISKTVARYRLLDEQISRQLARAGFGG